ncbi:hypothetical protein [Thomasclavelia cocleata]|uniref:hypothetical protein n=1 Tax=Thomasclavelia cocleata TaxID=69824 RepID=UPI00155907D6|nr:hypothetical protein [Thomasclavelia cocleata]
MTNLKEHLKSSAESNLENYKKLLTVINNSSIKNKEQAIVDCKHAIKKQEQIIQNIERWGSRE